MTKTQYILMGGAAGVLLLAGVGVALRHDFTTVGNVTKAVPDVPSGVGVVPRSPVPSPTPSPVPNPKEAILGHVVGQVTIGPFCPVERVDQPCATPPEAYTSRSLVVYEADATTVKLKVPLTAKGTYTVALASGEYWLQIQPAGIGAGEKKKVFVAAQKTSTIDFTIDTGIR